MNIGINEAPLFPGDAQWDEAQAALLEAGVGDGLPLVVPTRERLEAMLAGAGRPERSFGEMPPVQGRLTAEAVAYCCVIAGCWPAEFRVVLSAAMATLEDRFNLLGLLTTTGTPAVCLVVHGPITRELGMNAEANCLGPGNRANACIGRALQLVLRNVGGAIPGITDMATMGQPGKYVFCFAEGSSSFIEPLIARRGFHAGQDAVTVIGVSGTLEALPRNLGNTAESAVLPLIDALHGARMANQFGRREPSPEQFVLMPPDIVDMCQASGWDVPKIQHFIQDRSPPGPDGAPWPFARTARDIHVIVTGGIGIKMTCLIQWGAASHAVTRELVALGSPVSRNRSAVNPAAAAPPTRAAR